MLDYTLWFENVIFLNRNLCIFQQFIIVGLFGGQDDSLIRLPETFEARYVRLNIEQFSSFPCLRLDYIGCRKEACSGMFSLKSVIFCDIYK